MAPGFTDTRRRDRAGAAARGDRRHAARSDGRILAGAAPGAGSGRSPMRPRTASTTCCAPRSAGGGGSTAPRASTSASMRTSLPVSKPPIAAPSACATTSRVEDIDSDMADVIGDAELARVRDALSGGSANDLKMARKSRRRALAAPLERCARRRAGRLLLHATASARKSLMTKGIAAAHPDLEPLLSTAQTRFVASSRSAAACAPSTRRSPCIASRARCCSATRSPRPAAPRSTSRI